MRRLRAVFSREVAVVVIGYLLAVLLAFSLADAWINAHDALHARDQTEHAAERRIDQLQAKINQLQDQLRNTATRDATERGRLEDAIRALTAQIRQAGRQPVTVGEPEPSPSRVRPSPSRTASPRPTPAPSRSPSPKPKPKPTPTCLHVNPIHLCVSPAKDK